MRGVVLLLCVLASGCVATDKGPIPSVSVPVPVSCVSTVPVRPGFAADEDLAAMNDYQLVLALWRDRLQRIGYEGELEAVLEACRRR